MRKYLLVVVFEDNSVDVKTYRSEAMVLEDIELVERAYKPKLIELYKQIENPKEYLEKILEANKK